MEFLTKQMIDLINLLSGVEDIRCGEEEGIVGLQPIEGQFRKDVLNVGLRDRIDCANLSASLGASCVQTHRFWKRASEFRLSRSL